MHYHIMELDPTASERLFRPIKKSDNKDELYAEFRDMHDGRPDQFRFTWCHDEDCLEDVK